MRLALLRAADARRAARPAEGSSVRTVTRIPNFIEETLRLESPLRTQFRMARVAHQLGGVDIPAGGTIMLVPGACNRDPRVFENPYEFDIDRPERPPAHRVRARHPHVRGCAPGPRRGPGDHQPVPRPHDGHHDLGGAPRPGGRPPLRVPADLLPPRPRRRLYLEFTPAG